MWLVAARRKAPQCLKSCAVQGRSTMRNRQRSAFLHVSRRELMAGTAVLAFAAGLSPAHAAKSRFVFANESDYDTVDPHAAFDVGCVAIRLNIYDGLMRWQRNPAVLEPWVA